MNKADALTLRPGDAIIHREDNGSQHFAEVTSVTENGFVRTKPALADSWDGGKTWTYASLESYSRFLGVGGPGTGMKGFGAPYSRVIAAWRGEDARQRINAVLNRCRP